MGYEVRKLIPWLVLWLAIIAFLMLGVVLLVGQERDRFSISGFLSSTDSEVDEGYFAVDQGMVIMAKPGTDLHAFLRSKVKQRLRVTLESYSDSH